MKVLVATREGQGGRASDFCWTTDGELVMFGFECDRDEQPDDACGCKRALVGLDSQRATTTFTVEERNLKYDDYVAAIFKSLQDGGWKPEIGWAREEADEALRAAEGFPVGAVLEKRGAIIQERRAA